MELTEAFYVFFVSSIVTCGLAGLRMVYKSKCRRCGFCGITVERDVEGEERVDIVQLQRGGGGSPTNKNEESDIV